MRSVSETDPADRRHQIWRKWLYRYMDRLISDNIAAAPDYHYLLVELYADYKPSKLMRFLQMSHQYPLEQAYEICKKHELIREMVYILSRMGNTHEALQLIIKELADIPQVLSRDRGCHKTALAVLCRRSSLPGIKTITSSGIL